MQTCIPNEAAAGILAHLMTTTSPPANPLAQPFHVRLGTENINPTPGMTHTDVIQATFDGYAQVADAVVNPVVNDNGQHASLVSPGPFISTGDTVTETIRSIYIMDGGNAILLWYGKLDVPVVITQAGDFVDQDILFELQSLVVTSNV